MTNTSTVPFPAGPSDPRPAANAAIAVLALAIPVLVSALPLAIVPGMLRMAQVFGDMTAQFVLTLPGILMIVGAALCGYLSERWGRKAVIIGALAFYSVGGVGGFFATNLSALVVSRAIGGLSAGVLLTTVYALIGEYFTGHRRERLLGFMSMASSIASVGLLVLMGMVVERFGWRAPFLFYMLGLALVPFAVVGITGGKALGTGVVLSWRPVLRRWPIYLLLTAYTIGMFILVIQGPFLLGEKGITSPSTAGRLIALSSVFGAVGGACYGRLRRSLGFREMFVFISLTIGIGMLIAAWSSGVGFFLVSTVVIGLGIGIIEPTIASELLTGTPEPLHDRVMGVNVAAMFLGQFLNPVVVAPIHAIGGTTLAFIVIGSAYVAGGLLFLLAVVRKPDRGGARPEAAG